MSGLGLERRMSYSVGKQYEFLPRQIPSVVVDEGLLFEHLIEVYSVSERAIRVIEAGKPFDLRLVDQGG